MSLYDDKDKITKALQVLGYQFPNNTSDVLDILPRLPYEMVLSLRNQVRLETDEFLRGANSLLDKHIETWCDICEREGDGWGDLPEHWGWVIAHKNIGGSYLVCDKCQFRWAEKFNELPKIVKDI